jgi:hypothetical protein
MAKSRPAVQVGLEAQVRGSRHAWDIRLISADALIKLVQLKEDADAPDTGRKIRSLLAPMEYTRLDQMIDVMFTTAKDVETAAAVETTIEGEEAGETISLTKTGSTTPKGTWEFTDAALGNVTLDIPRPIGRMAG